MRWVLRAAVLGFLAIVFLVIWVQIRVLLFSRFIITDKNFIPTTTVAIIFGGGMKDDGTQSIFQADRVERGVELYKTGQVKKLIMTGDDGGNHDNEVAVMKLAAIKLGVPKDDIIMDPHGYRTYESCYRARAVYGVTSTIVVSQAFHVPRMLYLCRGMGISAVGVSADLREYGWPDTRIQLREVLARVKAWWQLEVTKPQPRSLEK